MLGLKAKRVFQTLQPLLSPGASVGNAKTGPASLNSFAF